MTDYKPGELYNKSKEDALKKHKRTIKMTPVSKGHTPKGAHGRAAVKALGRTKTTGNFAKIEKSKGKGAAIAAYQNALAAHKGKKRPKNDHDADDKKRGKKMPKTKKKGMMCKKHKKMNCKRC